ncbi:MAG: hypothetical protein WCP79_08325 [Bacillota bacterium]
MNSKEATAGLNRAELEQAVGGADVATTLQSDMDSISTKMQQVPKDSKEYNILALQLESLRFADSLTSANQLLLAADNSRDSNSDNCKKMVGDAAKAHTDDAKSQIQFR